MRFGSPRKPGRTRSCREPEVCLGGGACPEAPKSADSLPPLLQKELWVLGAMFLQRFVVAFDFDQVPRMAFSCRCRYLAAAACFMCVRQGSASLNRDRYGFSLVACYSRLQRLDASLKVYDGALGLASLRGTVQQEPNEWESLVSSLC